jgi:hypothetical protein
MKVHRLKLSSY